jgi:hypothetical protein
LGAELSEKVKKVEQLVSFVSKMGKAASDVLGGDTEPIHT